MAYRLQDPDSVLNWQHDWSDWLEATDTISSRQWTITPSGPTLTGDTSDSVYVSGLTAGTVYHLTEHVVTANGVQGDRTIVIRCDQR